MVNSCQIVGTVERIPRVSKTEAGVVANFPVVVAGKKDRTIFDVALWGEQAAENAAQRFKPGDLIYVAGAVTLHSYKPQDGERRCVLRLTASDARLLSSAKPAQPEGNYKEE